VHKLTRTAKNKNGDKAEINMLLYICLKNTIFKILNYVFTWILHKRKNKLKSEPSIFANNNQFFLYTLKKSRQRLMQTKIYISNWCFQGGCALNLARRSVFIAMRMWHLQNVFHIFHIQVGAAVPIAKPPLQSISSGNCYLCFLQLQKRFRFCCL